MVPAAAQPWSISVDPPFVEIDRGDVHPFTAVVRDQFGTALDPQPAIDWSVQRGPGTVASDGRFTAAAVSSVAWVVARVGTVTGHAVVRAMPLATDPLPRYRVQLVPDEEVLTQLAVDGSGISSGARLRGGVIAPLTPPPGATDWSALGIGSDGGAVGQADGMPVIWPADGTLQQPPLATELHGAGLMAWHPHVGVLGDGPAVAGGVGLDSRVVIGDALGLRDFGGPGRDTGPWTRFGAMNSLGEVLLYAQRDAWAPVGTDFIGVVCGPDGRARAWDVTVASAGGRDRAGLAWEQTRGLNATRMQLQTRLRPEIQPVLTVNGQVLELPRFDYDGAERVRLLDSRTPGRVSEPWLPGGPTGSSGPDGATRFRVDPQQDWRIRFRSLDGDG